MPQKKKVHLVLASGGARGMAHIGVIERLQRDGFEIIDICGCSMGAVVGGMYASGHLEKYKEWLLSLKRADVFRLLDFTLPRQGFLKGERVFNTILKMTGEIKIEELPLPFKAVATDSATGEEIVFETGDLFQALRATISIPGLFTPVFHNNRHLVDGGVINPLPLNLVKRQKDALVVAVDINARNPLDEIYGENAAKKEEKSWWPFPRREVNHNELGLFSVLQNSYDHMQNKLIDLSIEAYPPDLLVNIPRNICGIFDFYKAREVIECGYNAYDQAVSKNENDNFAAAEKSV